MKTALTLVLCAVAWMAAPCPGAAAQETSPKNPDSKSLDDIRREAVQRGLEAQLRGQEIHVTIVLKNATIQDGIDQFRRQVFGWDFILDSTNISEDFRVDEFIVTDKSWRDAFDMFVAKAGLMIDEERPGLLRLSKPQRLTLALKDADILSVIDMVARISRANIIVGPKVGGKITLTVNDVPWNVLLETALRTLGQFVIVRERFDILRIIDAEELKKQMETRFYRFKFIQPPPSYRAKIEENKQFTGKTPAPAGSVAEQVLQFSLLNMIRTILTRDSGGISLLGRVDYDPIQNALSVTDTKIVLERVFDLIKSLDVEPEQVLIDVKFVSTSNEDLMTFGMAYNVGADDGLTLTSRLLTPTNLVGPATARSFPSGDSYGDFTRSPFTSGTLGGAVTRLPFGIGREVIQNDHFFLTNYDVVATMRAFKRDRFSKLIQQPTLAVTDSTEATIFVGETISFAESRAQSNQFGGLEFTIAEAAKSPVKVGFTLLVSPKIIRDENKIILTIIPVNEFLSGRSSDAALAGFERFTIQGLGQGGVPVSIDLPRKAETVVVTRLIVENGRTAILGGLTTERISFDDNKLPWLGDLPLVNFLFKRRNDSYVRDHLLVFVTPRILRTARASEETIRAQLAELERLERSQLEEMRMKRAQEDLKRADEERLQKAAEEQKQLEQPK